ncbi:ATP-dependent Clp protease ATP-binding subunit [Mesorhizobium sp. M4B.F.Ca.ET.190.01.1.1]|uniref:ATP-dependent Clp protease ATP-binding subunit n=1 Tax=unclassified Mesorhizobium TaxID=325217 RepID=UPI001091FFA7|nr:MULTISPECIES: ATP-dependent Clp protease ATP-binding subunit [unclassified Mesorhizobium]TGR03167.1 ATP-dependent Clp protease ATP-binding subunit [Mesorhizobium sp. M4B.F.Ca.ET.200.01.1.1]TGS14542.1 ATP-dependent Clp protease ATP-binding subunit [Mesorhizobium sp. M4B.F.Ca.ET.190.01.1.1]TGT26503.1 ATP-dependent Clp protease ATP-binding subunit [Mesorhizobium sp. M4B.F.Ca.ET.172.01.1.1]
MAKLCDICKTRPATVRARITTANGDTRTLDLCETDYRRLARQQRQSSPLESLFGRRGGLFDEFFGDEFLGASPFGERGLNESTAPRSLDRAQRSGEAAERLSEHAKELLQAAARQASEHRRGEVDTEHLLLALTESDVVRTILGQFKVSLDDLRRELDEAAPRGDTKPDESGEIGVTPRMKSALGHAFTASHELGHSYVGPEHLLIGLAEEEEGIAGELLRRYGLTPQAIRQQVVKVVGRGAEAGQVETPTNTPNLDKYSRDLTKLAREGKLDPVIGRAREIETTIEVLARRKKNNPVLIGEPGVGKTAIVEGLAQRIVAGEVPESLRDKRLVELGINSLVAGSKYRGEFEERVQQVLKEVTNQKDKQILFIDEIHTIVGAGQGGGEGGLDIANVFKPALARGELNLVGATTLNEYQKHIEKDAALERRFQPVFVPEPSVAQTIMILRGLRDTLEAHHKVTITDEAVVAAAELSDRYITGRFLPDKAIDLIDQAAARVKISATGRPVDVQELEAETRQLKREQDYASSRKQFDRASEFQHDAKNNELRQATERWRRNLGSGSAEVQSAHIAEVVSKLTGIPVTELTTEERQRLIKLEERLHQRVIGQDEAVKAVSDAVRLARAGLREGRRPTATFLFLGPTGVGKTELAKALAEAVYGDEAALVRLDMSEYMERHTVARLIGAPPGYVGYEEGGQLTERVRRRPYSVVLLDEIEKAHSDVYNVLLQVFDDGRLTDGKGRVVDFTNTIIIATSNLGADIIQGHLRVQGAASDETDKLRRELMDVLRMHFRPEFLNRIDEIIVFHALDRKQIRNIVDLQLERVKRTAHGQGVDLEFDDSLMEQIAAAGFRPEFGARELRRLIRSELETELARAMLADEVHEGDRVLARWDSGEQKVRFEAVRDVKPAESRKNTSKRGKQSHGKAA